MAYQFRALAVADFMQRQPPANYIAGLGRGANGFTTRSDIGGIADAPDDGSLSKLMAAGQGQRDIEQYQDPDNEGSLFRNSVYEADDDEADRIWEMVEAKMDERRKTRREAKEREQLEEYRKLKPKIQAQFADLKRDLEDVTADEWNSLPEVGDLTRKRGKKQKSQEDRFSAVPDTVVLAAMGAGTVNSISAEEGTVTNFAQFGAARDKVLGIKLDQMSDSVSGQTTIDPKGYLTDLGSVLLKSDAEISDIKKARTLMTSVITTNPKHAPGWIAAARVEEFANKPAQARETIAKGCEACPKSEDVWLEAARLNTPENAKVILANAVRQVPQSVKIWLRAKDLENDSKAQKRVLRRALEYIPNSVKLWKAAVSCEEPEDARILLSRAVECVPLSTELWLALARLEDYTNAKKVLNKARAVIPTAHEIWICAAKLEETNSDQSKVEMIINRGLQQLTLKGSTLNREQWLEEAESCEKEGFVGVCKAIVATTIGLGIDDDDKKHTFLDDAEACVQRGSIETARAIYAYAAEVFPSKKSVWKTAAFFEKEHGTPESLEQLLQKAVTFCPNAEMLWLMGAKEKWLGGDIASAKGILEQAFAANPNSEEIWLAAIKLEVETGNIENARTFLNQARSKANTARVWMKSAVLERQTKFFDKALELLDEALRLFPSFAKLWMVKGQIHSDDLNDIESTRQCYSKALKHHPKSIELWILASRLEEKAGSFIKARATLEKARILNPQSDELYLESIRVETRAGNTAMAKALLAKSLQTCPHSGILWSQAILTENRPQRKARSADALKKCENDPIVVQTIARLFWSERKTEKARNWFSRAAKTNPDLGDTWAWWLKFEMMHGTPEQQQDIRKGCVVAQPRHGEHWQAVSKNLENVGMKPGDILDLVASKLENIF